MRVSAKERLEVSRIDLVSLLLLPILFFAHISTADAALQGRVVGVADGDTLTILDEHKQQHRVRLAEIDAPESNQPFGNRSKQLLSNLCYRKQAEVRNIGSDRYQRVVGTVYCDGEDANAELVRQGLAWVYIQYARVGSPLFALEQEARNAKRGLWSDPNAAPPWEWRRGSRASTRTNLPGEVRGNKRSMVFHLPHCPSYDAVSVSNKVTFATEQKAIAEGYRRAGNCR